MAKGKKMSKGKKVAAGLGAAGAIGGAAYFRKGIGRGAKRAKDAVVSGASSLRNRFRKAK